MKSDCNMQTKLGIYNTVLNHLAHKQHACKTAAPVFQRSYNRVSNNAQKEKNSNLNKNI